MNWEENVRQMGQTARKDMEQGAVTPSYKANREQVIEMLNHALASEWTAFLQYWHHLIQLSDIHSAGVRPILKEFIDEEYEHAQRINERINELGGVPANDPELIDKLSVAPYTPGHDLRDLLAADLTAERVTIDFYNDIIRTCGYDDTPTRKIFEDILVDETDHANTLSNLLFQIDAATGKQLPSQHEEWTSQGQQRQRPAA